jgi:predicted acyltransferase (DUF342 family)
MLWAIGALVVMGLVGAGIAVMTPSTTQSKFEQEAGMRAYYNANAGLNFVVSMHKVSELNNVSFSNYVSMMGGGGTASYDIDSDGYFTYALGNVVANGVNGTYQIMNLTGTVTNAAGAAAYGYVVYGGGKGNSSVLSYVPIGSGSKTPTGAANYVFYGGAVAISASREQVIGNIYGRDSITLADNAVVTGNLVSNGNVKVGSKGAVTGFICSDGSVSLTEDNVVGGTINANGSVTMESRTTSGSITAGGNVTLNGSAQKISGSINSGGDVTIASSANVTGDIVAKGSVIVSSSGSVISGSIHAGKDITINSKITVGGGLYSGAVMTLADDSISIGGDINAGTKAIFSGSGGSYLQNVYAGSDVNITAKTTINKNVEAAGKISIANSGTWNTCIAGVAKATGTISSCSGTSCGSGNCYIGATLQKQASVKAPLSPNSPASYVPCESVGVPSPPKNTNTKDGVLNVPNGGSVTFKGGTYYYSSITMEYNSTVYLDLSGSDITIFSTGNVALNGATKIKVSKDGTNYYDITSVDSALAAKVYLESNGSITLAYSSDWFGTLFARGSITFGGGNTFIGAYASQTGSASVTSGSGYSMTYVPSNYAIANWY